MAQEKISRWQLISIIILFEIGTTVLFGLRMQAKQDEWLAILTAMLGGLGLMWVYTKLCEYYPDRTLIQIIPEIVGKWLGYPLSLIYIFIFAYESSRVLRDFGELIVQTILTETPILVIMSGLMLGIVYCLRGGVEALARLGEILFPVAFLALVLGWILIFTSQIHHFEYIEPVFAQGIRPLWNAVFPFLLVFPFGQTLLFMMFTINSNDRSSIKKAGMIAILASGIILSLNMLGLIAVFGTELLKETEFPLYTAIGMVSLGDFIMNLDALAILMMVLGGFFKLGAFLYGTVLGTAQLFKLESYHSLLIPWSTIILAMSLIIASTYTQHIDIGWRISIPYLFFPFYVVVPVLLLIIAAVRKAGRG